MPITIDHLLVSARNRHAAASWLGDLLGIDVTDRSAGSHPGTFAVVRVGEVSVDFADTDQAPGTHIAFLVSDADFDTILDRVLQRGLEYTADPGHTRPGKLNDNEGGRGFYVLDPDGNNYEFLTRTLEKSRQ
jgi:catechol 2,3-dioxygenase-like lactoylglutathione lyase family enzyme